MNLADKEQTIDLELIELRKETEKAYQVKLPGGIYWIPKSCCRIVNKRVYISKWFADQNNIDYLACDITNN